MTKQKEKIAPKNYFAYVSLILITVFLTIYISNIYKGNQLEKQSISVLNETISKLELDEVETYLVENKDIVIYITNSADEDVAISSKKLLTIINTYNLETKIVYINIASVLNYKEKLNDLFPSSEVPNILIYKESTLVSSLSGKEGYTTTSLISYFAKEGIIETEGENIE